MIEPAPRFYDLTGLGLAMTEDGGQVVTESGNGWKPAVRLAKVFGG